VLAGEDGVKEARAIHEPIGIAEQARPGCEPGHPQRLPYG
jgi:hypothetical protein